MEWLIIIAIVFMMILAAPFLAFRLARNSVSLLYQMAPYIIALPILLLIMWALN